MIAQKTDTTAPSARKSHIGIVYSILMVLLLLVLFLLSPANKVYASVVLTAVLVIATGLFGREELDETKMSLPMILAFSALLVRFSSRWRFLPIPCGICSSTRVFSC